MTTFRDNREADPMAGSAEQIAKSATFARTPQGPYASRQTGQDAELSKSVADLKQSYLDAAKFQGGQEQQAAIHLANANAQIDANTPAFGAEIFNHRPEQYEVGNMSQVPSTDPVWKMPVTDLRHNLELIQDHQQAVAKAQASGHPMDVQRMLEAAQRMEENVYKTVKPFVPDLGPPITQEQGHYNKINRLSDSDAHLSSRPWQS